MAIHGSRKVIIIIIIIIIIVVVIVIVMLLFTNHRDVFDYPILHTQKKVMLLCITFNLSFEHYSIYYTNTGSNHTTGNYWSHKTELYGNSPLTHVTNDIQDLVKCSIKRWMHLDLRPDDMLFGGLQPKY